MKDVNVYTLRRKIEWQDKLLKTGGNLSEKKIDSSKDFTVYKGFA
jgi:hypothetical protein